MLSPQSCVLARYSYDPLDRLISHTRSTAPALRFYCEKRLVTEIQGALRHSIVQHDDLLLAQQQRENEAFGTTLLATDLQRSVLHTLEKNAESRPIAYSAYGYRSAESGLTTLLGFSGERQDPVTGYYLLGNGYRAFNPVLMRFNSPDSWSPFGDGGLNPYSYCLSDPVNLSDRSGHIPILNSPKTLIELARAASKTVLIPPTSLGLFEKLNGSPHLFENIIHRLKGKEMKALAQTSSEMKKIVYSAAKPLPKELSDLKHVELGFGNHLNITIGGDPEYLRTANFNNILNGEALGILPVQIPRNGIKVVFSAARIKDTLNIPYERFPTQEHSMKAYTLRALT